MKLKRYVIVIFLKNYKLEQLQKCSDLAKSMHAEQRSTTSFLNFFNLFHGTYLGNRYLHRKRAKSTQFRFKIHTFCEGFSIYESDVLLWVFLRINTFFFHLAEIHISSQKTRLKMQMKSQRITRCFQGNLFGMHNNYWQVFTSPLRQFTDHDHISYSAVYDELNRRIENSEV